MAGPGVFEPQRGDLTFYGGPAILAKPWLFSSHWLSADSKGNWRINLALDKIKISGWLAGAAKRPGALLGSVGMDRERQSLQRSQSRFVSTTPSICSFNFFPLSCEAATVLLVHE